MHIIDLDESRESLYCCCLEDWSLDIKEAGNRKGLWYGKMKHLGLRVKLVLDDNGTPGGMIQYYPIEHSFAEGKDLYLIGCIWVHGHKQGRGDFQKKGMGAALLKAAEEDARSLGAKGIAAWGLRLPFWMRASWYKKHGYKVADKDGIRALVWKQFAEDAQPPKWIKGKKDIPVEPGKVTITAMCNGWCPAMNLVYERAKRAAAEPQFEGKVVFNDIDTSDREVFEKWKISDALFINKKEVNTGPPPAYEKIRKMIEKEVRKI
jgi:GNAT superfamily N-acetyltransferase